MTTRERNSPPSHIEVTGARVHNLKGINVKIPLGKIVAVSGVSGSGKSSLAMGVIYAEGSRRYIEALSTYTRRRMTTAPRAAVDSVRHVPAALALRQRPGAAGVRSTLGTTSELLNIVRLMFSRLGSHMCPNGHYVTPSIDVAAGLDLRCSTCETVFAPLGAEGFAFNSEGACPTCEGTGAVRVVNDHALVPDLSKSIADGAVSSWSLPGLGLMPRVVAEMGVRTNVPYRDLTPAEVEVVLKGPEETKQISVASKNGKFFTADFMYRNARRAVEESLKKSTTEKGLGRVSKYLSTSTCPDYLGTRFSERARRVRLTSMGIAEVTALPLTEVLLWTKRVPPSLPADLQRVGVDLSDKLEEMAARLVELGLSYLTLDRPIATLSTGERQRVQLARAVRNETTGVLYVLDEPSIGLHAANVDGLIAVMRQLLEDGNSVVVVDHDIQVLRSADWLIEIGPGSGTRGGSLIAEGTTSDLGDNPHSLLGSFLNGEEQPRIRPLVDKNSLFKTGRIALKNGAIHTLQPLTIELPVGRLTAVTGVSGSGKTTLILDSLVPALRASGRDGSDMPSHVLRVEAAGILKVEIVDGEPIGTSIRSTVATYSGIMDDLRRAYAATDEARELKLDAFSFSYNTGSLRCDQCDGTGQIALDVQFLPDVEIPCPSCEGSRYSASASQVRRSAYDSAMAISLPELLQLTIEQALGHTADLAPVRAKLQNLVDLGLDYLVLGQSTPSLSGGEAQRLKLASEVGVPRPHTLFVFDEPSVGLHPLDVRTLLKVFQRLLDAGATIVVIEHDLDMIANADFVVDMGPGGGTAGGRVVATGTPEELAVNEDSTTGAYLQKHLGFSLR